MYRAIAVSLTRCRKRPLSSELTSKIVARESSLPRPLFRAPGLLQYFQVLDAIQRDAEDAADDRLEELDDQLDRLIKVLQATDAGDGESVLGFSRWQKFFGEPPMQIFVDCNGRQPLVRFARLIRTCGCKLYRLSFVCICEADSD